MKERFRLKNTAKYLILIIAFLLIVNVTLGWLLMRQSKASIISLMHTRMLDISNTAAAMIDGDVLKTVTPADEGTEGYETIMRTLTYFQDNIDLKYIYCIRDMGDGTFTFGLDPTVEDPGEFGSPIVYTDALYRASRGTPAADEDFYEDAWGRFYSAYSPVFDSQGAVAGIIAVDFSAEWYDQQVATQTRTTAIVAGLSLLLGAGIVTAIITRSEKRIGAIQGQLDEMENTLMQEMGNLHAPEDAEQSGDPNSLDSIGRRIQTMQTELRSQIAQVHVQAYQDGLTGVKSKHAYLEAEKELDEALRRGEIRELAVVVCDVNGLKKINDTFGHKAGDEYIRKACAMICDLFAHSPVYRIGGDEFVAILRGRDFVNRRARMQELHELSVRHIATNDAIVSGGLADYLPEQDQHLHEVFERADVSMYEEKQLLKSLGAATREDEAGPADPDAEMEEIPGMHVRKHILIADDVATNREILGDILQDDYDILYAADGVETLDILRSRREEVALLLLDLYMPKLSGQDVMTEMQVDADLMSIPVIVQTVDQEAELLCLKLGAMDFIPKPYPDAEIIKTRVAKCIELSETRDLIRHTQRDKLTGLYNVDYFMRYVKRYDQQYKDEALDAVVCDVNDFYGINEQYGRQFGDLVLRSVGISFRKLARKTNGIGCRKGSDTFLLYCPHRDDYEVLLKRYLEDVFIKKETVGKVRLRFGVYENADREPDVEKRFACALLAADSVKDDPEKVCGFYAP